MKHSYCWTGSMPCTGNYQCTHCKKIADVHPLDYSKVDRNEQCPNRPFSMTSAEIESLAKENHYVNNLICMKQMFGMKSKIGLVLESAKTVFVSTIAEIIALGWCDVRFAVIDDHIGNLQDIYGVALKNR